MDPTLRITWVGFFLGAVLVLLPRVNRIFHNSWVILTRIARRRFLAPLAVFIFSLALGAVPSLCGRVPIPFIHDEFANLLAADTFAHGRLTNPTPPLSEHFETIHVLMHPSYASKFPPGLGLALAVGKILFHLPAVGAFGSVALACAATGAALRYWLPPRWALLGGLLAAIQPVLFWWGQGYWGGQVAMIGGAILLLGCGRAMRRQPDARAGIAVGIAAFILAISRPLEGLIVALLATPFLIRSIRRRDRARSFFTRMFPSMLLVLVAAGAWLGYYNHRVTGDWSQMPWAEYGRQSMTTPIFLWQPLPDIPTYHHERLQWFHMIQEREEYDREIAAEYIGRIKEIVHSSVGAYVVNRQVLLLGIWVVVAVVTRSRRFAGVGLGLTVFIGLLLIHPAITPWMRTTYTGPASAGVILATIVLLRAASRSGIGRAIGGGIVVAMLGAFIVSLYLISTRTNAEGYERRNLLRELQARPEQQIVLVRYVHASRPIFEWVYNDADIPDEKIIFARSKNQKFDAQLLNYFHDRKAWILTVADFSLQLTPFDSSSTKPQ